MDEFSLIKRHFAPLATFPGSLNLTDDAAIIAPPPGHELVITKDALIAGVHFFGDENPSLIAQKALRVNLSDLAAMGAAPLCYFIALMLPKNTNESWLAAFAEGLQKDQKEFNIALAGGDTTATPGPLSISITALGSVPTGTALKRSTANIGDAIFVSGSLGDSALGLASLRENKNITRMEQRYLLPEPRLALGQTLRTVANACMDISDGLLQDLGHICAASHVGASIHAHLIPTSDLQAALSGGDDYELLFTVPPEHIQHVPTSCTKIGEIVAGKNVQVLDESGNVIAVTYKGYSHF